MSDKNRYIHIVFFLILYHSFIKILLLQIKLRAKVDAILINAARDLRTKADHVVRAFNHRITNIDEACRKLESELTDVSN